MRINHRRPSSSSSSPLTKWLLPTPKSILWFLLGIYCGTQLHSFSTFESQGELEHLRLRNTINGSTKSQIGRNNDGIDPKSRTLLTTQLSPPQIQSHPTKISSLSVTVDEGYNKRVNKSLQTSERSSPQIQSHPTKPQSSPATVQRSSKQTQTNTGHKVTLPKTTTVSTQNAGTPFSIQIYSNNDIVSNEVRHMGGWEMDKIQAFNSYFLDYSQRHNIPLSKLTFVDIGANIGWFSLNMAALGVNVLAFEPMQENIQLIEQSLSLEQNVASGISDRITLFRHGLGVKDQTCVLYSHNINVGDGHVKCVDGLEEEGGEMEKKLLRMIPSDYSIRGRIPIRRLDDVIQEHREEKRKSVTGNSDGYDDNGWKVVCVKMDTEGYEGNVLEGGKEFLLQSGVDIIVTEFVPQWLREKGGDPVAFMGSVKDAGYRIFKTESRRYMSSEEMMDMRHYPTAGDLTLHSPTYMKALTV